MTELSVAKGVQTLSWRIRNPRRFWFIYEKNNPVSLSSSSSSFPYNLDISIKTYSNIRNPVGFWRKILNHKFSTKKHFYHSLLKFNWFSPLRSVKGKWFPLSKSDTILSKSKLFYIHGGEINKSFSDAAFSVLKLTQKGIPIHYLFIPCIILLMKTMKKAPKRCNG